MARGGGRFTIVTKILLIRGNVGMPKPVGQCMGTLAATDNESEASKSRTWTPVRSKELLPPPEEEAEDHEYDQSACWVPHHRTGIYFPKGEERVMDDVPDGAASLVQTHWFRNDPHHGVDH